LAEEDQNISLSSLLSLVMTNNNNQVQYISKETDAKLKESTLSATSLQIIEDLLSLPNINSLIVITSVLGFSSS
jgi:hypothetical protein